MTRSIRTGYLVTLAAVFAAMQILLGAISLGDSTRPAASVAAMVVYGSMMIIIPGRPGPLPRWLSIGVLGGVLLVTSIVQLGLPLHIWPGYTAWHTAALQCLLIVVALRGNVRTALAAGGLLVVLTLWWSAESVGGVVFALRMALPPVVFMLVAVGLGRFLAANDRAAAAQQEETLRLLDQAALADGRREQAIAWGTEIGRLAGPLLELAGDPATALSTDDRQRMLEVEGRLRDRVRGGSLATPEVLAAVDQARARQVAVRLLDDRGAEVPDATLARLALVLTDLAPQLSGGTLTIRARPEQSSPEVTIAYVPESGDPTRYAES